MASQSATMYRIPSVLRYHVRLFQILGFHTLSLYKAVNDDNCNYKQKTGIQTTEEILYRRESQQQQQQQQHIEKFLQCWAFFLVISFTVLFIIVISVDDEFVFREDRFGNFNDILKFVFAEIAILAIYWEALLKRSELSKFWQLYMVTSSSSASNKKWCPNSECFLVQLKQHKRFLLVLYIMVLLEAIPHISFWIFQNITRHLFLFWTTFQPFACVVHLRNLQFILHIELMHQELVQLERELALLVDYTQFATRAPTFRGFEDYVKRRIWEKQLNYQRIHAMYLHFQNAFGYSVVAVLIMVYVRVLVDFYFLYYTIYREWAHLDYLMLTSAVWHIPVFIFASQSCMKVIDNITYQLHSIISVGHIGLSLQIQNFSLQILHQRIRIDGYGITSLDGYMLTRAIGSVTTYMIFFIQFMPRFGNFHGNNIKDALLNYENESNKTLLIF